MECDYVMFTKAFIIPVIIAGVVVQLLFLGVDKLFSGFKICRVE